MHRSIALAALLSPVLLCAAADPAPFFDPVPAVVRIEAAKLAGAGRVDGIIIGSHQQRTVYQARLNDGSPQELLALYTGDGTLLSVTPLVGRGSAPSAVRGQVGATIASSPAVEVSAAIAMPPQP